MKRYLLLFIIFQFAFASIAQQGRRLEVLFLGDGGHHKPIEKIPYLMQAFGPKGINLTYTDDLNDLNSALLQKYDALMIYANWDEISAEQEKAMLGFVNSGKALIPVHCASYCFRNSPDYIKLVGGQFWKHGMDSVTTINFDQNTTILKDIPPFTVYEETYLHTKLEDDNHVIQTRLLDTEQQKEKNGNKTEPVSWTRTYGKGKIFYTALGHEESTWSNPDFQKLIFNGLLWAIDDKAKAEWMARNAKAFEYREAKLPNYERRKGPTLEQLPLSPEESMKHIQVPVDFKIELYASEPDVMHPIAFTWDEKGRLFVLITKDYPNDGKPSGGSDYILLCEDKDQDGKADTFTKWAEGLSIPTGLVFANGGLIVSQAPDMLFLKDTDGDNKADLRKTLFTGFGTFDTHAGPSNLHYGFDNWIYACVGYAGYKGKFGNADSLKFGQAFFKFKPDGTDMEWLTTTSNNTWGLAFNEDNSLFGSTANNAHGWYMAIPHRYFNSKNLVDNGSRSTDTHKDIKPITEKVRQVDVFGGFTAASGHNFYSARNFPEKYWNKVAFVAEPTGHLVHQNIMEKNGTDYYDKPGFNLVASADEWFSPVAAEVGPDGAVWVLDWYSYIIQHNPVPEGFVNGPGNAYETNLRDFSRGRIYRVSPKNETSYSRISLSKDNPNTILSALQNNNMFWRLQAQRLIVENNMISLVPQLKSSFSDQKFNSLLDSYPLVNAIWALKGLNSLDEKTLRTALQHPSWVVRMNAIKTLPENENSVNLILEYNLLEDKEPLVVLNSLLIFSKSNLNEQAKSAFFKSLKENKLSTDRWLPDAYATVLSANNAELLKTLVKQIKQEPSITPKMDHSAHMQSSTEKNNTVSSQGLDLVVEGINFSSNSPEARDRVKIEVIVKNTGSVDLPKDTFVPLEIRIEGDNALTKIASRNFKDGIKAGESVSITKSINGPWVGDIAFYTDIPGKYSVNVMIDEKNELNESIRTNNNFSKPITFSAPSSLASYAMERATRSYASYASVDSLVSLIKISERLNSNTQASILRGMAKGYNYKSEYKNNDLAIQDYLIFLQSNLNNQNLNQLMLAWQVIKDNSAKDSKLVVINTLKEKMKYDQELITVKAGEKVHLVFNNPDAMQHNLLIIKPNSLEKVGNLADEMATDENAILKNYVPESPDILYYTGLVNPDQSYVLDFVAPDVPGDYPFVCTFPGHWRLMNGIIRVEK